MLFPDEDADEEEETGFVEDDEEEEEPINPPLTPDGGLTQLLIMSLMII